MERLAQPMSVQIRLLGAPRLLTPEDTAIRVTSRRSWALLAFLVQSGGRAVPRGELAHLLWPDSGGDQARASLRQELAVLRRALRQAGIDPIDAEKESLRYIGPATLADTSEMERRIGLGSLGDLREAAALYAGAFLDGVTLRSEAFAGWLAAERARLQAMAAGALEEQLRAALETAVPGRVVEAAEGLLAADPLNEGAVRALMQARHDLGHRAEALRQYELCRAHLQRTLKRGPAQATFDLAERIRASRPIAPPPELEAGGQEAAIAVLHLPGIAALAEDTPPEAIARGLDRFAEFAARMVAGLDGRVLPGLTDRVVAAFSGPDAAVQCTLAALMIAGEPVPLDGGARLEPAGGVARGRVVLGGGKAAGTALARAAASASAAAAGEVLADAALNAVLSAEFAVEPVAEERIRVTPPEDPRPAAQPAPAGIDALWHDWRAAMVRADLTRAGALAEQGLAMPDEARSIAQVMQGAVRLFRGQVAAAEETLVKAAALYTVPEPFGLDPGITGRCLLAWARCLRGAPGRAAEDLRRVLSEAQGAEHAPTLLVCHLVAAAMQDDLGETRAALSSARQAFDAAKGQAHLQALARGLVGRARDRLGEPSGAGVLAEALASYRASGAALAVPILHAWLAEASLEAGRPGEGLVLADEGLSHAAATGSALMEPELLRLQALLLVRKGPEAAAEAAFVGAIESAQRGGAGLHELRASVSHAGHLRRAGRPRDAAARLDRGLAAVDPGGQPVADIRAAQSLKRMLSAG